ncbi:MAG: hypothetical protein P8N09_03105 [Planctomycetota bacterium]|nr:hypothetical protein [Planctomycetota bacterium]
MLSPTTFTFALAGALLSLTSCTSEGVATAKPLFVQARSDTSIVHELQAQVNSQLLQVSGAMSAKISP